MQPGPVCVAKTIRSSRRIGYIASLSNETQTIAMDYERMMYGAFSVLIRNYDMEKYAQTVMIFFNNFATDFNMSDNGSAPRAVSW